MINLSDEEITTLVPLCGFSDLNVSVRNVMGEDLQLCRKCMMYSIPRDDYSDVRGHLFGGRRGWKRWPDALSATSQNIIVSERALKIFRDEGFTGFRSFKFRFSKLSNKNLSLGDIPSYYLLIAEGRVPLDESGQLSKVSRCNTCGVAMNASYPFLPNLLEWDGSDFVYIQDVAPQKILASGRVVDAILRHDLTGFAVRSGIVQFGTFMLSSTEGDWRESLQKKVRDGLRSARQSPAPWE